MRICWDLGGAIPWGYPTGRSKRRAACNTGGTATSERRPSRRHQHLQICKRGSAMAAVDGQGEKQMVKMSVRIAGGCRECIKAETRISHLRSLLLGINRESVLAVGKDWVNPEGWSIEPGQEIFIATRVGCPGRWKWTLRVHVANFLFSDSLSQIPLRLLSVGSLLRRLVFKERKQTEKKLISSE